MNVAIIIGHNRKSAGAYCEELDMTENEFARIVASDLLEDCVDVDVYTRRYVDGRGYSSEMAEELAMINAGNYDLAIEVHFNAAGDPKARGVEALAFYKSTKSLGYAREFCKNLNQLIGIPIRRGDGVVPVKSVDERGGYGIIKSKCPYILIEPFFASNKEDSAIINPLVVSEAIKRIILK